MGTRSFVAEPYGDSWRGRYVHWDGYPTYMGPTLQALIARDSREVVLETICHLYYGWSSLNAAQPYLDGVTPNGEAPWGSPEHEAYKFAMLDDGRFANVCGYGTAYTTYKDQSHPDEWITPEDLKSGRDWGTEWGYVLFPREIVVLCCYDNWEHTTIVSLEGEPDWEAIEKFYQGE